MLFRANSVLSEKQNSCYNALRFPQADHGAPSCRTKANASPSASGSATRPATGGSSQQSGGGRCSSWSSAAIPMRRSRARSASAPRRCAATSTRRSRRAPSRRRERYVHLQVARIEKALLAADAAIERGDVRAVSQYLKVVAALDRYHGLAAALTPPEPASAPAEPRLPAPAPPLALTHAAPPLGRATRARSTPRRAQNGA